MATSVRGPARQLAFRWHLLGLAAVSLLPVVVFAALLVGRSAREERTRTEHELVEHAQLLAGAVDREVEASLHELEALARSEQLARGDLAGFRREAARVAQESAWLAALLFTPDGRRILDTREAGAGGTAVDPVSFAAVLRTRAPVIGDLVRARDGVTRAFAIRVPVLAGDRVVYVVSAAISARAIGKALAIGGQDDLEWTRTVVDRAGTVVARTRGPEEDWVGRQAGELFLAQTRAGEGGAFRAHAFEGVAAAVGFARAPLTGWTAAVFAPSAVVDAPVRRSTTVLVVAGLVSVLLSVATAFVLSRRFARAVGSAADAAQALATGGGVAVSACGIREVARLGDALASSAQLLEARREEGDRHVAAAAAARRAAEASSRAKDEFLAMLGHELRNPLSPILTALHLLRQRGNGWGREHEIIARQVGHVVRLVDDLLDVSRVTRAKIRLHREQLELASAVARAVEMASPLLEERHHRLAVDVPAGLTLVADPVRLAQVVANLLTNAARYTPPGGHVAVTARREGDRVAVEVADDGQGIGADLLPRVFDLFVQGARGPDRAEGGLGIGLALVKSLVALHGGTVEARSDGPGRGSTFRIVLPCEASVGPPAPVVALLPARTRTVPRLRVLVVDDNVDAATLLADFIGRAGHTVEVAHDGPAALTAAEVRRPDVVVLDVGLPVMDGYEVAELLRQRHGAAAPAIVGVTGYGQERDRARSHEAGFLHHLVKPADPADVLAAVEDASGHAGRLAGG
jgi:signal transduction histidine kinase/ActR/RegA family two-component response regulator